jgi:hypothetical protein
MTAAGFAIVVAAIAGYRRGALSLVTASGLAYIGAVLFLTGLVTWLWQTFP